MSDASLVQIPLGGGLDETNEDTDVPADKMRVCQNVVFPDMSNATTRRGLKSLGATTAGFVKIIAHDNEVIAIDGQQAWAYVPSTDSYVSRGPISPCTVARALLASGNSTDFANPVVPIASQAEDFATKLRIYAWCDGIAIQASILDTTTGNYVVTEVELNPTALAGAANALDAARPRVVIVGGYAYIIYIPGGFGSVLRYRSINLSNVQAGFAAEANLGSAQGYISTDGWDACACFTSGGLVPHIAVATMSTGAAPGQAIWVSVFSAAAGVTAIVGQTSQGNSPTSVTGVAIASTPQAEASTQLFVVVAHYDAGAPNLYTLASTSLTPNPAAAPTILHAISTVAANSDTPASAAQGPLGWRGIGCIRTGVGTGLSAHWLTTWTNDFRVATRVGGVAVTAADHRLNTSLGFAILVSNGFFDGPFHGPFVGFQTQSKPQAFVWNGVTRYFVLSQYQDGLRAQVGSPQSSNVGNGSQGLCLLLVDGITTTGQAWSPPQPCAVAAPRFAGNSYAGNADVVVTSDGNGIACIGTEQDVTNATSLSSLKFNFNDPALWQSVQLGNWTWIAAGLPMQYDGSLLHEAGFINAPPTPVVAFPAPGGGVLPAIATLTYFAVYVQQDSFGNIHRSPPSAPAIVNATGGFASSQLAIVPCAITLRQQAGSSGGVVGAHPVRIEIYRNNSGAGLTVFQLIASIPNDPTAVTVTYTDTTADAAGVTSAPLIYTTGGAVSSDGPPGLTGLAVHADRIFGISEDGQTSYFTTPLTRSESPRFTDAFTITWPNGPVVMQWSLEQRLHGATADAIFYTFGDGPNDNGAGPNIELPSLWQASLGLADPRGFCLFTEGALLYTKRGLYLEGRDGSFTWISQCRRTLDSYPVVTGMTALDTDGAIRINVQNFDGPATNATSGLTLHYDYRHGKWSQHLFGSVLSIPFLSSCLAGGVYYALDATVVFGSVSSLLLQEDATSYHDTLIGTPLFVSAVLATGWADVAGKQGSARVQRAMVLGQAYTPHGLTIETARDYSRTFDGDVGTWTDSAISAMAIEQMRHTPTQQKCMAMSVRVTTTAPTVGAMGTGQGPTLRSVVLRTRERRGEWKRTGSGQQG